MCQNILKEQGLAELDAFIAEQNDKAGALIAILHRAQHIFGYLPAEIQKHIATKTGVSLSHIYGVVSFYSYFTMVPKGKYPVSVCMGTACYVRGADKVLAEFENVLGIKSGGTTEDGKFSLDILRCVGACGIAPVVLVGETVHKKVAVDQVRDIISKLA